MKLPKRSSILYRYLSICVLALFVAGNMVALDAIASEDSSSSTYQQAITSYLDGDLRAARDALVDVLERNPDDSKAQQLLDEITSASKPTDASKPSTTTSQSEVKRLVKRRDTGTGNRISKFNPVNNPTTEQSAQAPSISENPIDVIRHVNPNPEPTSNKLFGVNGIRIEEYDDRIRVKIKASGTVDYLTSKITEPPMVIVDIPNSVDRLPKSPLPVGMKNIPRIRHSQYKNEPVKTTRVVVDMERWNNNYRVYRGSDNQAVVMDFYKDPNLDIPEATTRYVRKSNMVDRSTSESGYQLTKIQGDSQELPVNSHSRKPLTVQISDTDGDPVKNEKVTFQVTSGSGRVVPVESSGNRSGVFRTDQSGKVSARFRSDTKAGISTVRVSAPDRNLRSYFNLFTKPGAPVQLVKITGDRQRTLFGRKIGRPIVAELQDTYGNPVPGALVRIQDGSGKGLVDTDRDQPGAQQLIETNRSGRVRLNFYRIPPDVRKNQLRMSLVDNEYEDVRTTFTVIGEPQLISIDFKNANLQDVLRTLAELSNWNIALPEEGTKKKLSEMQVTVHLREVTALRALDTILDIKNLSRVADGNLMKIVAKEQAVKKGVDVLEPGELDDYDGNNMVTVTYQLTYLKATDDLANQIQKALLAENASVVVDGASNSLVITDLANNQRRMRDIIEQVDRPDRLFKVRAYELQNTSVEEVASGIGDLLPTGQGNVVAHKQTNTLLVFGDPSTLDRISKIVNKLDESGTLVDYWRIVDVEGFDPEQIAKRVNSVLAIQLFDVSQLQSLEIELAEGQSLADVLEGTRKVDIGKLLNSAAIIALPNMEKIIVFGPPDIRKTAVKMIEQLKRKPGKYITDRTWEWINVQKMPIAQAKELVQSFGGMKIQMTLKSQSAMLVSSQNKDSIAKIKQFMKKIENEYENKGEVISFAPAHADVDIISKTVSQNGIGQVLYSDDDRIVLSVPKGRRDKTLKLLRDFDKPKQGFGTYKFKNYSLPSGQILSEWNNAISQLLNGLNLGNVSHSIYRDAQGQAWVSYVAPRERLDEVHRAIKSLDKTEEYETKTYELSNLDLTSQNRQRIKSNLNSIINDHHFKANFVMFPRTNSIIYNAQPDELSKVKSIIEKIDRSFTGNKEIVSYSVKHIPRNNLPQIEQLLRQRNLGTLLYLGGSKIVMMVTPDKKSEVREFLNNIDQPSSHTHVVKLDHRNAQDLANTLQTIFGQQAGAGGQVSGGGGGQETSQVQQGAGGQGNPDYSRVNIGYDNATNSIFFSGPEALTDDVRSTIEKLDTWQKQVLIEARLVEITLDEGEDWSPSYIAQGDREALDGFDLPGSIPDRSSGIESGDGGGFFNLGGNSELSALLDANEFNAVMKWVARSDKTKVLTRPSITALNNSEAQLDLTEQRFFRTIERDDEGNPISTTFEPQEANKVLSITPTITAGENVILDVSVKNDVFGAQPGGPGSPFRINTRRTENSVLISENQTLVLGGIIQKNRQNTESGIPFLKDLPVVGNFAKTKSKGTVRTELVVFMTPHIIGGKEEVSEVSRGNLSENQQVEFPPQLESNKSQSKKSSSDTSIEKDKVGDIGKSREQNLNLNEVSKDEFNGIFDRSRYKSIVDERNQNGPFRGWNDLYQRMDYTGDELTLLKRKYVIESPTLNLNEASREELRRLDGIDEQTAKNIVDYRYSFGEYETVAELRSIPNLSKDTYRKIKSYLYVEQRSMSDTSGQSPDTTQIRDDIEGSAKSSTKQSDVVAKRGNVNLNSITSDDFKGEFESSKFRQIVEERKADGYFKSWNNLKSRMGYTEDEISDLRKRFEIEVPPVNVNTASVKEMSKLPDLDKEIAQNIVDYRYTFGEFQDINELTNVPGVDKKALDTLRSFLIISQDQ